MPSRQQPRGGHENSHNYSQKKIPAFKTSHNHQLFFLNPFLPVEWQQQVAKLLTAGASWSSCIRQEWTSLPMPELLTTASCRKDLERISAESLIMSQPPTSRNDPISQGTELQSQPCRSHHGEMQCTISGSHDSLLEEHQAHDQKIVSSNLCRSCGESSSPELTFCDDLFHPMLLQWQ